MFFWNPFIFIWVFVASINCFTQKRGGLTGIQLKWKQMLLHLFAYSNYFKKKFGRKRVQRSVNWNSRTPSMVANEIRWTMLNGSLFIHLMWWFHYIQLWCHWNVLPSNVRWKRLGPFTQIRWLDMVRSNMQCWFYWFSFIYWNNPAREKTKVSHPAFWTNMNRGNEDMIGLMTCNTSILCDVLFHFFSFVFFPLLLLIFHMMVDFFCQSFEVWAYHFSTSTNTNIHTRTRSHTKWIYSNSFWVQDKFDNTKTMKSCANLGLSKRILHVQRS